MDYHFLKPQGSTKQNFDGRNVLKLLGRFLPLFVLAAILPLLVGLVAAPPDISFLTRADVTSELRVWLEPANILVSPGSTTELAVIAQFDSEDELIPEISLELYARGGVVVENTRIVHSIPFSGRAEIGRVFVRAVSPGSATVGVSEESIEITALEVQPEVSTAETNVIVKQ